MKKVSTEYVNLNVMIKDFKQYFQNSISLETIQKTYIPQFKRKDIKKTIYSSINSDFSQKNNNKSMNNDKSTIKSKDRDFEEFDDDLDQRPVS